MNEELIKQFCNDLLAEGISNNRIKKYNSALKTISKIIKKDFRECNERDLRNFFANIEKTDYSYNTKRDFRVVVKRFWKWLLPDKENPKAYPIIVRWIATTFDRREEKIKLEKDVLTREEVYKMVDCAEYMRDKAFISLLFEGCMRISEATNLKVGSITFDDKGYNFVCDGKNGNWYKRVMSKEAVEYMRNYLDKHPEKDNPNAPLWITLKLAHRGEVKASNRTFYNVVLQLTKTAKITKHVYPHLFRDSWITWASINGIPEAIIKKHATWTPDSRMLRVYQHLKSHDIDNAFTKIFGIDKEKELDNALRKVKIKEPEFYRRLLNFVKKELESENK
jgi:integrase